jgi:hypothetical protein
MARRLCVVIGPFRGAKFWNEMLNWLGTRNGFGSFRVTSSGLPRSQARLSKSPKMWQLAHAASPLLDVSTAS